MTATATKMTKLEKAELALRNAVASGNTRRIDGAAKRLQELRDEAGRLAARKQDVARAEHAVNRERILREQRARKQKADEIEAELRSTSEVYATVHVNGRVCLIDLSANDQVVRGTAIEAVRRVCLVAANAFQDRLAKSRNKLSLEPGQDVLTPMLVNSHGLLYAAKHNVVGIKDDI